MKKIFIYYSFTGNGDVIANYLKEKGYEIRKVIPKKPLPGNFFLSIITGGFQAYINKKDKLVDFDSDISKYDKVIIGSPIWNDRLSSPINTVLDKLDFKGKQVSFILYSGSGKAHKASQKIREIYTEDITILKRPKDNKFELRNI